MSKSTLVSLAIIGGLASCSESTSPAPDLTGLWARNSLQFEEPASGPGPVVTVTWKPGETPGPVQVGDYTNPILQPWAADVVKGLGEQARTNIVFPDPENQCLPFPLPNILRFMQIEVLQQRDHVTILYSRNAQVRRVRLNGSHPTKVIASSYGDSVGHYEGDTLVVDTVGIKVGPLPMVDWYGTPYTEALHVVERYRLIDHDNAKEAIARHETRSLRFPPEETGIEADVAYMGKALQIEFTVDDTGAFTMPWSAVVTFRRSASPWAEDICAENLRDSGGPERKVPRDETPDF